MRSIVIIIGIFSIFIISPAKAQERDKRAQDILKEVTNITSKYSSLQLSFTYTMDNKEAGINESFNGTLLMQGDMYRVDVAGQRIISDGKTVWTYIEDAEEVQIHDAASAGEALIPSKLLTSYSDDYRAKLIREDTEGGRKVWVIDLNPITGKSFFKVRVVIDQQKKQINSLAIHEKNGSVFTYRIRDFKPNAPVSAGSFTFNRKDYPGVDIIDMR